MWRRNKEHRVNYHLFLLPFKGEIKADLPPTFPQHPPPLVLLSPLHSKLYQNWPVNLYSLLYVIEKSTYSSVTKSVHWKPSDAGTHAHTHTRDNWTSISHNIITTRLILSWSSPCGLWGGVFMDPIGSHQMSIMGILRSGKQLRLLRLFQIWLSRRDCCAWLCCASVSHVKVQRWYTSGPALWDRQL